MQAQERIPMPLDRAVMDFQSVGLVDTPDGQRLRVIVVVTEREGVDRLLHVLRQAGLRPEGIDLSIFAVIRALGPSAPQHGPVLYAQLGDLVNIAIAEAGVCRFTRQAPQGLAMVLGRLAENQAIPLDEAQALLQSAGHGRPGEVLGEAEEEVAELLARTAVELGSELRAAAEFYSTQFGSELVTSGVVAGSLAPLPGFVQALSRASGLELICGEVKSVSPEALGGIDPRLTPLACGLAVGELR
jgi:type IV pilus assembly protein PilM